MLDSHQKILLLDEDIIRDSLKEKVRQGMTELYDGDDELLVAFVLKRFCEQQWKEECKVGIPLKNGRERDIPNRGYLDLENFRVLRKTMTEQATPIDFCIVRSPRFPSKKAQGMSFQLKRFGKGIANQGTEEFINRLENIASSFAQDDGTIVFLLEIGECLNTKIVVNWFSTHQFSFQRTMFVTKKGDTLMIGEFWPNPGMQEYNLKEFFS